VRLLIQQAKPQLIYLQETKLAEISFSIVVEFLGDPFCNNFIFLPAEETRGGVLIAWDKDYVDRGAVMREDYNISVQVTLLMSNGAFGLTAVYDPTNSADKPSFLDELVRCQPISAPWLYIGDFNLHYEASDKSNHNINWAQMRRFRQALDSSGLLEIKLLN
jgi:exonuclease III